MTELTKFSPSVSPPSVLCGSGILSQLASPWSMASSGHFGPSQTYDGFKEVEVLDPACTKCLAKGKDCLQQYNTRSSKCHFCFAGKKSCCQTGPPSSNVRRYLWSQKDGPFGKEFPVSEAPIPDAVVVHNSIGHQSSTSPSHPPAKRFQSHIIPRTPRTSQPTLATIPTSFPPASPSSSTARPALIPEVRPFPIHHSRNSPIVTSQQLQSVSSSSRRREELSPFPFPAAQVFQKKDHWPIQVTREDPNTASENQDSVARFFKRVDRNGREVIEYVNDGTIPGTSSEEMEAKFSWYEEELINDLKRTFDNLGRDN
ncbi:hypothetical protein O181_090553 [Austropuccinia psidii MF-1]|uniref:Uncharacterized protein n=1 Tax=Austropuccinia psidii MF-1 TaxID=1389203 RepID=A0A9Q3IV86_9BASI|nr:hypothetical protein [Austropuccinia psidii MF-1]